MELSITQNLPKCEDCPEHPSFEIWWENGSKLSHFCSEHFSDFIRRNEIAPTRALSDGELFWSLNGQEDPVDDLQTVFAMRGGAGSGNFGHAGRLGKVGGSAPSGSELGEFSSAKPRNEEERQLQDFVRQLSDLKKNAMGDQFEGFEFRSSEEMVLELGRFYQPPDDETLPMGCEIGVARECFSNAFKEAQVSEDNQLVYTEGIAMTDIMFPTNHAWLTTKDGRVVDPTWLDKGVAYYGIPMDTSWVTKQILKNGYYGVLPSTIEIFENGIPENAIIERGGPGSGNFDHVGRPGEVGGSAPSGESRFSEGLQRALEKAENQIRDDKFETAIAYTEGGREVFRRSDDRVDGITITENAAENILPGTIFTHNHPGSNVFSYEDILMFSEVGMKEMRAVGADATTFSARWENQVPNQAQQRIFVDKFVFADISARNAVEPIWEKGELSNKEVWVMHWEVLTDKVREDFPDFVYEVTNN